MTLEDFLKNAREKLGPNLRGLKVLAKKEGNGEVYRLENKARAMVLAEYGWRVVPTPPVEAKKAEAEKAEETTAKKGGKAK